MTNLYLAAATDTASMLATFIPLILMIVVFYFLLIRPQKKRDKEVQKMRENIEIADEIVTMHGGTLTLENAEGGGTLVTIRLPAEH